MKELSIKLTDCLLDWSRVDPFHQVIRAGGRAPQDIQVCSYFLSADKGLLLSSNFKPSGRTL